MRKVRCFIKNGGTGDIELIDDNLDHGEWADGESPTEQMSVIKPTEEKFFRAEQGGDIPLIGSFATGTQGWVLFRTLIPDPDMGGTMEVFIRVYWNLPYVPSSSDPTTGGGVNAFRYDPRIVIGKGQFDTRDKRPPPVELLAGGGSEDTGGDRFVFLIPQAYPWMLYFPPMVLAESDIYVWLSFEVKNTVAPESTKLPGPLVSSTKSVTPVPEPLTGTTSQTWRGTWRSEHVIAQISQLANGMLDVAITETTNGHRLEKPSQTIGISRLVFRTGAPVLAEASSVSMASALHPINRFKLEEHEGLGSSQPKISPIERASANFSNIVKSNPHIVAAVIDDQHQIGGDYLRLAPDAVLEIYKLVAGGTVVDIALRYRRPSTPGVMSVSRIDEMLKFELPIR